MRAALPSNWLEMISLTLQLIGTVFLFNMSPKMARYGGPNSELDEAVMIGCYRFGCYLILMGIVVQILNTYLGA
jgi:hypothetical protein